MTTKKKTNSDDKGRGVLAAGKVGTGSRAQSQSAASSIEVLDPTPSSGQKNRRAAKPKLQITKATVKSLGFSCDNMTDAAVLVAGNLVDRLKRSTALRQAWARGRFLRDISSFASVAMTKAEAATRLDLPLGAFETLLSDPEAADVWTRAQRDTLMQLKTGILTAAMAGNQAALKRFERILQEDRPDGDLDICSLSIEQMVFVTGVTRMTLHKWVTEGGLTRKGDLTFDLRVFIKWFEGFSQRKVNVTPQVVGEDSLRDLKAKQLSDRIDVERGKLIPRDAVVGGYVARTQWDLDFYDRNIDGVCNKCANMPPSGVREILDNFQDQRRLELSKVKIEMKLTDELLAELVSFLKKLE